MGETVDDPHGDNVAGRRYDNRNRRRHFMSDVDACRGGDDNLDFQFDQLGHQTGEPIIVPIRITILDEDIFALDIAEVAKTRSKRLTERSAFVRRPEMEAPNPSELLRLFGARRTTPENGSA
jgi:hypothetical protein